MKSKKTKTAAKKSTAKKQPAKKVAPKKNVKVKVLTFEPDEVLQLKEHITALKDVIKMQKESANKLRKKNKTLQDTITDLKKKLNEKNDENDFLSHVTTSQPAPGVHYDTTPRSPFASPVEAPHLPAVPFPNDRGTSSSKSPENPPNVIATWGNHPVVPAQSGSSFLKGCCAIKY